MSERAANVPPEKTPLAANAAIPIFILTFSSV
jgi:hypothetical protein